MMISLSVGMGAAADAATVIASIKKMQSSQEYQLEARRAEWLEKRRGRFTASNFGKIMAGSKTASTYIAKVTAELLSKSTEENFKSLSMQWGIDHEAEAVKRFSEIYGFSPYMTGNEQELILSECGSFAGTPDGLIDDDFGLKIAGNDLGLEIKCPNQGTHLSYFQILNQSDLKTIKPEYYWQCYGYVLLTGRSSWYFISYDPRFDEEKLQLHSVLIKAEQSELDLLKTKLDNAIKERDRLLEFAHRKLAA